MGLKWIHLWQLQFTGTLHVSWQATGMACSFGTVHAQLVGNSTLPPELTLEDMPNVLRHQLMLLTPEQHDIQQYVCSLPSVFVDDMANVNTHS